MVKRYSSTKIPRNGSVWTAAAMTVSLTPFDFISRMSSTVIFFSGSAAAKR